MSVEEPIVVLRDGSVATIELNDPPYNRLGMALIDMLERVIQQIDEDESIRAVVLRGSGDENFSVGADIREFGAAAAGRGVKRLHRPAVACHPPHRDDEQASRLRDPRRVLGRGTRDRIGLPLPDRGAGREDRPSGNRARRRAGMGRHATPHPHDRARASPRDHVAGKETGRTRGVRGWRGHRGLRARRARCAGPGARRRARIEGATGHRWDLGRRHPRRAQSR